ncbi:MAG: peptidylprolyl isomerase [Acidimicrobiia bacterium]|nr:peptidylprolyl isomerase [Acidimicrobiia bacterium]
MCIDPSKTYTATMQTSQGGPVAMALDAKKAPRTVNNFVVLARYHFYDGLTFHRIVPDFVIQGGDPQGTGQGGPGYQFADELPQAGQYKPGSLAMANSGPNTNGSQFFIVLSDNGAKQLQPLYSLFGQVTGGMDVVDKIAALGDPNAPNGEPKQRVTITSVTIQES